MLPYPASAIDTHTEQVIQQSCLLKVLDADNQTLATAATLAPLRSNASCKTMVYQTKEDRLLCDVRLIYKRLPVLKVLSGEYHILH